MKFTRTFITLVALIAALAGTIPAAAGRADEPNSEQRIAAAEAVTVLLCLESGSIVVRGWERKEVRARNAGGGQIELRRADATVADTPVTRVEVLMSESPEIRPRPGECGRSGDVELDVPRGSAVQLKGRNGDMDVTGVASLRADTQSGSIELRDITQFAEATTANGDITLRRARGRVRLRTISGQVWIGDAGPEEPGDDLWAKTTSGDITLDNVRHARVEAATASGSVNLAGTLAPGGFYDLKTTNGDVTLTLPTDSSFFLNAKVYYGGDIVTDFPIRIVSPAAGCRDCPAPAPPDGKDKMKPHKPPDNVLLSGGNLTGVYGQNEKGDATLTLASFSGSVRLRKKQ